MSNKNIKNLTKVFLVLSIALSITATIAYVNAPQKLEDICLGDGYICLDVIPKELPEKEYSKANKLLLVSVISWTVTVSSYLLSRRTITTNKSKM